MTTKILLALISAAILISALALMLNRASPSSSTSAATPTSLFPALPAAVNDVATIEITRPGEALTIARNADRWVVASKGDYPARIEQVKSTVLSIAGLKPLEAKTSNPTLYARLGVQDPTPTVTPAETSDPSATTPTLVTLKGADGGSLASLIIGTQKWGTPPTVFVRKAGDSQSWLAEAGSGGLQVSTDPLDWIERQILNISRDRIKSVSIVHPADGAEVEVSRENNTDACFTFTNIPDGREPTAPTAPETLVTGIQYLSIDDFDPIADVNFASPDAIALYRTFDGLVITIQTVKKDDTHWINLSFSVADQQPASDEPAIDAVRTEAQELTDKLARWAFAIPQYKAKTFLSRIDDFLKPLPTPAPSEPETDTNVGPEAPSGDPEPDTDL